MRTSRQVSPTISQLHAQMNLTSEQVFAVLAAVYKCLEGTAASSLCWVIEQAVASNITSALVVADIVTKMRIFPLELLRDSTIPTSQMKSLVRLAMHVIVDRFGTLTGPSVTVKEYADMAHLCMTIYKKSIKSSEKRGLAAYAGEYTPHLVRNKLDLVSAATTIQELSSNIAISSVSVAAILGKYLPANSSLQDMDGETYIYTALPNKDYEESTSGASSGSEAAKTEKPPVNAVHISQLPTSLRKTNHYYSRSPVTLLVDTMLKEEGPDMKAFRLAMSALSACGLQSASFFEQQLQTHYQLPYMAVDDELAKAFELWLGDDATDYLKQHKPRSLNKGDGDEGELNTLFVNSHCLFVSYQVPPNIGQMVYENVREGMKVIFV